MRSLSVNVFPGALNIPLWAGMKHGFFASRELEPVLHYTPNSVEQLTGLASGQFDIAMTAIDNVIAYKEKQGEVPAGGDTDFFAFMGSDDSFLRFVVQEDVKTFEDVRGKILTVDALTTGFAFVLRRMLVLNDISEEEIDWMSTGGVLQRWQEMMAHPEQKGTLQVTPFEIMGASKGHHVLARASDVLDSYQGTVGGARVEWARNNADDLAGFIAGWLEGVNWLYDRSHHAEAADIILEQMPQMPRPVAEAALEIFFDEKTGMRRDGAFDIPGIETVLDLRREFGPAPEDLHGPEHYIDTTYLEMAKGR